MFLANVPIIVPLTEDEKVELLEKLTELNHEKNDYEAEKKFETERLNKKIKSLEERMNQHFHENEVGETEKIIDCYIHYDVAAGEKIYFNAETGEEVKHTELTDEEIESITSPSLFDKSKFDDIDEVAEYIGLHPNFFGVALKDYEVTHRNEIKILVEEHEGMPEEFPELKNFIGRAIDPFSDERVWMYFFARKATIPEDVEEENPDMVMAENIQEES